MYLLHACPELHSIFWSIKFQLSAYVRQDNSDPGGLAGSKGAGADIAKDARVMRLILRRAVANGVRAPYSANFDVGLAGLTQSVGHS